MVFMHFHKTDEKHVQFVNIMTCCSKRHEYAGESQAAVFQRIQDGL